MVDGVENLKWGQLKMPATGAMIIESHYITQEDGIKVGSLKREGDNMQGHLDKSCAILKYKYAVDDCADVYKASYARVWNGGDGAGANLGIGGLYYKSQIVPDLVETEMFQANMYWTIDNMPPYPTKYLIKYKNAAVVVNMGYEQGPPKSAGIVGIQPEIAYFLGAPNQVTVTVGKLKDQSLPYGPVICK